MTMPVRSAYVGQPVTLQCSNADWDADPVTWLFQPDELTVATDVYANGELFNGHRDKCSVDTSTPGRYDLLIFSAHASDSGIYTCREKGGYGTEYKTMLMVIDFGRFWVEILKMEIGQRKLTDAISERDRDIFALTSKPSGFKQSVGELVELISKHANGRIDAVVSPDSRGFAIGGPVAYKLGLPLIPIRKEGKLPGPVEKSEPFITRKDENRVLEVQTDVFNQETRISRVVIIDDELASGGNTIAAVNLLKRLNVDVAMCVYVQELEQFKGREHLTAAGIDNVYSLVKHGATGH